MKNLFNTFGILVTIFIFTSNSIAQVNSDYDKVQISKNIKQLALEAGKKKVTKF